MREVKYSTIVSKKPFEVPSYFISSQSIKRYPPNIPTQPTLDLSYTSSIDIPHQDSSSSDEIWGVSSKEPLYLIPKSEVNQCHCHTRAYLTSLGQRHRHTWAYLTSLGQISIIYQIPRSRFCQRRTQPNDDGETLTSNIDDLIIDTIS